MGLEAAVVLASLRGGDYGQGSGFFDSRYGRRFSVYPARPIITGIQYLQEDDCLMPYLNRHP